MNKKQKYTIKINSIISLLKFFMVIVIGLLPTSLVFVHLLNYLGDFYKSLGYSILIFIITVISVTHIYLNVELE